MSIQQLNAKNFKQTIDNAKKVVLVDFYADWCGPCKMLAPVLEEVAAENDDIEVYKVNIDENPTLAAAFSVKSIPTLISFKDSAVYKQVLGGKSKEEIVNLCK